MKYQISKESDQSQESLQTPLESSAAYPELTPEQEEEIYELVQKNSVPNYRVARYRVTGYLAAKNEVEVTENEQDLPKQPKEPKRSTKRRGRSYYHRRDPDYGAEPWDLQ